MVKVYERERSSNIFVRFPNPVDGICPLLRFINLHLWHAPPRLARIYYPRHSNSQPLDFVIQKYVRRRANWIICIGRENITTRIFVACLQTGVSSHKLSFFSLIRKTFPRFIATYLFASYCQFRTRCRNLWSSLFQIPFRHRNGYIAVANGPFIFLLGVRRLSTSVTTTYDNDINEE